MTRPRVTLHRDGVDIELNVTNAGNGVWNASGPTDVEILPGARVIRDGLHPGQHVQFGPDDRFEVKGLPDGDEVRLIYWEPSTLADRADGS